MPRAERTDGAGPELESEHGISDPMEMFQGEWSTGHQRDNGTDETGEANRVLPQSSHGKDTKLHAMRADSGAP